ncbi:MAG TPA: hypothetical protein DEQ74_01305 [Wolbachia sp.]|nr:hypothetical protein [Wolbachia sp.]
MENYFLLFTDNLLSSLILPVRQSSVFIIMLYFKQYHSILLMLLFGVLGSSLGGIINWCLGRTTLYLRKRCRKLQNEYVASKIIKNLLICAVTLLSWVPAIGSVTQILSGYFKLSPYLFIFLTILSNFCYLLYLVIFLDLL